MKEQLSLYKCRWLNTFLLLVLIPFFGYSQKTVTVIDKNQTPLIGVFVLYAGNQTVTGYQGKFTVTDSINQTDIIELQYLGFEDLKLNWQEIVNRNYKIEMKADDNLLDEIVIIGRNGLRKEELPFEISRISSQEIIASNIQTTADALQMNGETYIQKSQMGGGSPVVRGFEANKLLLVVDGVRMNNAIYRNGHLQNAITIDADILDQIEVIYGPGSLMYGSEALGGVVHFETQSPKLVFDGLPYHSMTAATRYNTSNDEKSVHLQHQYSGRKFGVMTALSFSDFDDLRSGRNQYEAYPQFGLRSTIAERINGEDTILSNPDPFIQKGTAYHQSDFFQKWVFGLSKKLKLELNLQHSRSGNIPRYDNLIEERNDSLRYTEWYYGPQIRTLISPRISYLQSTPLFDKMLVILSYQEIHEDRVSRIFNNPLREFQNEKVDVFGVTLDLKKRLHKNHHLDYGLDFHHNEVLSEAQAANIETGELADILTRYPSGGSSMDNGGLYVNYRMQNDNNTIVWNNGLRWSYQNVSFSYNQSDPFVWPDYFYSGIKSSSSALVGITGLNINTKPWLFKLSTGTAFRSPNVDDLAKIRVNNEEITVPNPDLRSEKVWNNEISINYRTSEFSFGITGFYTRLADAIVRSEFSLPDGSDYYFIGQDSFLVTANVNASSGIIKGLSANMHWTITPQVSLQNAFSILNGTAKDEEGTETPLGHIPPAYGSGYLAYDKGRYSGKFRYRYNAWKNIEDFGGSVDNPELATKDGSPAWIIFNLESQYQINARWTMTLGLNNILDQHYRPFASGLSGPGRHISVGLRYHADKI